MLDSIILSAKEGGKVLRENFKKEVKISAKSSRRDLVTEVDLKCQKTIIESLKKALIKKGIPEKEIGFIGEEEDYKENPNTAHTFIIDPLDGTSSYVQGLEFFTVSIGYLKDGKLSIGVVYDPMRDKIYFAEKGNGAYKLSNGKKEKLKIKPKSLKEAGVAFLTGPYPEVIIKMFQIAIKLTPDIFKARQQGGMVFSFMYLLENHFQAVISGGCKIWDIAAAKLLIVEAGGVLIDWQGKDVKLDLGNTEANHAIIASSSALSKEILKYV